MFEWSLPVWADVAVFLAAGAVIAVSGVKASSFADRLADRTGLGEAIVGMVFLGLITAVPGLVASVVAALGGHAGLAITNALGGVAVQTAVLALADLAHPRANLEHAAASVPNMMQTTVLILLLTLVLAGLSGPDVTAFHVHPVTIILLVTTACAIWLIWRTREQPMWKPQQTVDTVEDTPEPEHQRENLATLLVGLTVSAGATAVGGAAVAEAVTNLVTENLVSQVVAGGLLMAVATSLPEMITSVAAVRRGALTLAVSDIVGGNFFDVLFLAAADFVYLHGSLYHGENVGSPHVFLTALTILLNVLLLMGLIYRQRRGPGNIGFESLSMLLVYIGGFLILSLAM
jgi:cation:H+ antiporter